MIKELNPMDIPALLVFLRQKEQRELFGITEAEALNADMMHYNAVLRQCLDSQCSFVSVQDDKVDGIALGVVIPLVWSPNRKDLVLLAVQGKNRVTTGRLFKTWHEHATSLPGIRRVLVDKIDETNFNYEKLGYNKLRETYAMEV